ncbi:hypothetical protein LTR95_003841 [Oleoguttula sp. CCFEE 5521]
MASTSISPPSAGGNASITGVLQDAVWARKQIRSKLSSYVLNPRVIILMSRREANTKEVELIDNDPAALEALLLRLYQHDYDLERSKLWQFYLALDTVADENLLSELRDKAFQRFDDAVFRIAHTSDLVLVLRILDRNYQQDTRMRELRDDLRNDRLDALLGCLEYRTYLNERPDLLWLDLDDSRKELAAARSKSMAFDARAAYVCTVHEAALASGDVHHSEMDAAGSHGCLFKDACSRRSRRGKLTISRREYTVAKP